MNETEGEIQSKCSAYLKKDGWFTVKNMVMSMNGYPDMTAIKEGRHLLIEFKTPTGRLSPIQVFRHEELKRYGCEVITIRSLDELKEYLDETV